MIELLEKHFKSKVSIYRKRIEFENLKQNSESVSDWFIRIKSIASQCAFAGTMLEERVKDKFVVGMRPGQVQDRLCEEDTSKALKELLEIALNKEASLKQESARRNAEIHKVQPVNRYKGKTAERSTKAESGKEKVEEEGRKQDGPKCYRCGKTQHNFKFCKFRKHFCKKCKKKGHISSVCTAKVENFSVERTDEVELPLLCVDVNLVKPLQVDALLNDNPVKVDVDTGAGVSCIPLSVCEQKLKNVKIKPCEVRLKTYSGEMVKRVGEVTVNLTIFNVTKRGNFVVVKKAMKILLGRNLINAFNLSIRNSEVSVNEMDVVSPEKIADLVTKFPNILKNELGTYSENIHLEVQENVRPIFHKPRPIPFAYKEKVKNELDRLENAGVIKRVSNAEWGTPIIPVIKADGKNIRICANYKITINKY